MSESLAADTDQDLPVLVETAPFERLDPELIPEERTVVDPKAPLAAAMAHGEFDFEDSEPHRPAPAGPASARLPLPAPSAAMERVELTAPGLPRPRRVGPPVERSLGDSGEVTTAVSSDPMAPLHTQVFGGRYRMVRRIGEGGMGRVYLVMHAQLGKTFALKISFANDSKARESFYREARLASSLSHPNIASVVDFGEDDKFGAFMVMEYLEGEMLAQLLHREHHLGIKQACDILLQICEAIHYIHGRKIVHCDLKSENIMLCELPGAKRRSKTVKLLDFGLARNTAASRNTASLSGTPHYVAPERIRGAQASPSSDIYGLGILFYEMITGGVPWDGNVAQILCGHLEQEPPDPVKRRGEAIDPAALQLLFKALKKSPADRHKDVAALIYELRTVMDMLGVGRRHKLGSQRRIVIERAENKRDELARLAFDGNRLPLAMISATGLIIAANPAFAKFVMGVAVDVEGLTVQSTPLAAAWSTFATDLGRACAGQSVRRILEVDVAAGDVRRLVMWLDPGTGEDHALFGVHPLDS
jgi:hypothetical protein